MAIGALFSGFLVFGVATVIAGLSGAIFGLAWLAFAALWVACAYGLWTMQAWAWPLAVVLAAAEVIWSLLGLLGGAGIVGTAISVIIGGAIIYYLYQPPIRTLFGR